MRCKLCQQHARLKQVEANSHMLSMLYSVQMIFTKFKFIFALATVPRDFNVALDITGSGLAVEAVVRHTIPQPSLSSPLKNFRWIIVPETSAIGITPVFPLVHKTSKLCVH